ncbi:hypothetical protein CQ13_20750 [Bradyrhizobium retamae]|uniref:Uncharacterized protein n=1 Tax=Bradyrhizobium retamae TaxID=1300035 RepID=A0A0R3N8P7_9BRAD|nr:hypothetical protein CQ13_20750 [Bradyrhizobium retamae]
MQRLPLFSPVRFLAAKAAEEAKALALATVEDHHGPRDAAAMIASRMMRRLAPPGVIRTSYVTHCTLL